MVIKGIGQARQEWLREMLNITSLYDLAKALVDEIETQYRAANRPIARKTIEAWITQASILLVEDVDRFPGEELHDWTNFAAFRATYQQRPSDGDGPEHRTIIQATDTSERKEWRWLRHDAISAWIAVRLPESEIAPSAKLHPEPVRVYYEGFSEELRAVLAKLEGRSP